MKSLYWFGLVLIFNTQCKREVIPNSDKGEIGVNITYRIDQDSFCTNTFKYFNEAGNNYSITKLHYYLSQIRLIKTDSMVLPLKDFQYVDAESGLSNQMVFDLIPEGNYLGIEFNIGLDPTQNMSDSLPSTFENINMIWPDFMGGGYHFLKLEGHFKDSSGVVFGYAMHLGTNPYLVPIKIYKSIHVKENARTPLQLIMNINEWFRNPQVFNFNTDGNYIMGNMAGMKKISNNGRDVFSF